MHPNKTKVTILSLIALGAFGVRAQETTDTPESENASDVVTLPEFSVTSSGTTEYMATESTTGTRIASKIKDLPFTVNVVTGEFMNDFNAQEFGEQFAYTSNVVGYETISTGYSVRGFEADVQLRNGFRRIGLIDKVSVDRAEVIKGPAASIYGTTLPGGIVNIVTKKPKTTPENRVGFAAGSNNFVRAEASSTGPIGNSKNWFYRVDVAGDKRNYDLPYKTKKQSTGSAQLEWRPNSTTSFLFEVERLVRDEHGNANTPFIIQTGVTDPYRIKVSTMTHASTYTRYIGLATDLIGFNAQGPMNYSQRFVNTLTGTFEHRFNDTFSFRSSANWFDRDLERQEVAGRDQYNPATAHFSNSTSYIPRLRPYGEGGAGWQNDLLASFDTGPIKHKLLVTLDWQLQTEQPVQINGSAASFPTDSTVLATGLDPAAPDYRYYSKYDRPDTYTGVQNEDNSLNIYGVFLSERASFWDGRVIAMFGGRYDYARNHSRTLPRFNLNDDPTPNNDDPTHYVKDFSRSTDSFTYQSGLNFKIVNPITLYANASKSFVPQFGFGTNPDGSNFALPNETGTGWEAGVKAALLDEKLTFTLGYFDITRHNIARDAYDTTSQATITYLSGTEAAKGLELDFNWAATSGLQFFGGLGWTDSEVIDNVTARHLIGSSTRRTPEYTVGVGSKYEFKSGSLKGLYFTAGYKYNSESLVNPSTGRNISASTSTAIINTRLPNGLLLFPDLPENQLVTSGSVRVDDGRESIYNAAFHVLDLGAGYKFRGANRKLRHKVQVNVANVFDDIYTYGSGGYGARRGVTFTYDLTF